MADALISPAVGGIMWAAAVGTAAYSIKKLQKEADDRKIPMMGVMGAFVFAAQMINFAIPGTGSSGHIGGGMLLAVLLGPYAGFLAMASVLLIQALLFADGGLLAYGCNLINMGFFTCFVAYPLIYRNLTKKVLKPGRILPAVTVSAIVGLQLGAFSVVLETLLSGKTELPFKTFALFMQPIHLAIGTVEGIVTAAVIGFVWKTRPEILENTRSGATLAAVPIKRILLWFIIAAVFLGGFVSWFAASSPDGLEWSLQKVTGSAELENKGDIHQAAGKIQEKTALMPDYQDKPQVKQEQLVTENGKTPADSGTSAAGLLGAAATLLLAALSGFAVMLLKKRKGKGADKVNA